MSNNQLKVIEGICLVVLYAIFAIVLVAVALKPEGC